MLNRKVQINLLKPNAPTTDKFRKRVYTFTKTTVYAEQLSLFENEVTSIDRRESDETIVKFKIWKSDWNDDISHFEWKNKKFKIERVIWRNESTRRHMIIRGVHNGKDD